MAKLNTKSENVVNPFESGIDYKMFLDALGSNKVEDYLKGVCNESQIEWIKTELLNFKQK